jgi:hypothetical protein
MAITINNRAILSGTVRLPLSGRWTADLRAVGTVAFSGAMELDLEGAAFRGTVVRSDVYAGETHCRLVGGAGGLDRPLPERWYRGSPTLRSIVEDILRETGEALSVTSDDTLLGSVLPAYLRTAGTGGACLRALLELYGARGRVLADGTVRIIEDETWPVTEPAHSLIDSHRAEGWDLVYLTGPLDLAPGVTFRGRRIRYVEHELSAESVRTRAYETDPRTLLERFGGRSEQGLDYTRLWPGVVERQNADGSVDVIVQALGRAWGITGAQVRTGYPSAQPRVSGGESVLVGFEAGDPRRAYATAWRGGGTARWGTVLIVATGPSAPVPGTLVGAQFFEATAIGDLALLAAVAVAAGAGNVPHQLPLTTSEVQSGG